MSALDKAFATTERSYALAKAAASGSTSSGDILARGPEGAPFGNQSSFQNARQQLAAFSSWVFAAIRPICNRIAAQPVAVGRVRPAARLGSRKSAVEVEPLPTHPIIDLLGNPNDLTTGWGLMWSTVASINLTGKGYWWIPEGNENIYPIPVSWVQGFAGTTRFQSWRVLPPGSAEPVEIPSERMVYFCLPSPSDPWGSVSPLAACAAAVNSDADIQASQRAAFAHGIHPSHAVVLAKDANGLRPRLTPEQQRQIVSAIRKRYEGVSRHGEPLIVDGLIEDVRRLSNLPAEMDWKESGQSIKERILLTFGTSSYILGGTEPGSRAASAVAEMHFLSNVVNPLIRCMSEAMCEWMSPMFSADGERLRIWIEPAVAADDEMRLQWAQLLTQSGACKANELRRLAPLGLTVDDSFDDVIVGGGSAGVSPMRSVDYAIRQTVNEAMGNEGADKLLELIGGRNGTGRM